MKQDDIIRMAREAGSIDSDDVIKTVYAAFAKAEREACAKVCEALRDDWMRGRGRYEFMGEGADYCADAIRERGQ
jgi:hypothetical protein